MPIFKIFLCCVPSWLLNYDAGSTSCQNEASLSGLFSDHVLLTEGYLPQREQRVEAQVTALSNNTDTKTHRQSTFTAETHRYTVKMSSFTTVIPK